MSGVFREHSSPGLRLNAQPAAARLADVPAALHVGVVRPDALLLGRAELADRALARAQRWLVCPFEPVGGELRPSELLVHLGEGTVPFVRNRAAHAPHPRVGAVRAPAANIPHEPRFEQRRVRQNTPPAAGSAGERVEAGPAAAAAARRHRARARHGGSRQLHCSARARAAGARALPAAHGRLSVGADATPDPHLAPRLHAHAPAAAPARAGPIAERRTVAPTLRAGPARPLRAPAARAGPARARARRGRRAAVQLNRRPHVSWRARTRVRRHGRRRYAGPVADQRVCGQPARHAEPRLCPQLRPAAALGYARPARGARARAEDAPAPHALVVPRAAHLRPSRASAPAGERLYKSRAPLPARGEVTFRGPPQKQGAGRERLRGMGGAPPPSLPY